MTAAGPKCKKKCRQYSSNYLELGFIPWFSDETKPMCLLCEKTFSNDAMKPAKMKDHLRRLHPDKKDRGLNFFKALKEKYRHRLNSKLFTQLPVETDDQGGLTASYNISLIVAKHGEECSITEKIIIPAVKEVIETVMKKDSEFVLKSVPLSTDIVQSRIDEMADNVETILTSELKYGKFSVLLDEWALGGSNILTAYVRYFSRIKHQIIDEFLFSKYLRDDENGLTILQCLEEYLNQHDIPLANITAVAMDGAASTPYRYRNFAIFLKQIIPGVRTVHSVLYRNHLVAKPLSEELHSALKVSVKSINKIKKHPLGLRLSVRFCETNDELSDELLLHTDVRWLSRGVILQRLVESFDTSVELLADIDSTLSDNLRINQKHLYYLADLFSKFNDIQIRLHGKDDTIIQARTILLGFQVKLGIFKTSLQRRDFQYFSNLQQLELEGQALNDFDLKIYIKHLEELSKDFKLRFEDLENMYVPDWIISPFPSEIESIFIESNLQDEIIELSVDLEAKSLFRSMSLSNFWTNVNIVNKYPKLCEVVNPFLLAFPSSNLAEAGFNHINSILIKKMKNLNIEKQGDLRLKLTNLDPDVATLVRGNQPYLTHIQF